MFLGNQLEINNLVNTRSYTFVVVSPMANVIML